MSRINAEGVVNDMDRVVAQGAASAACRTHHDASLRIRRCGGDSPRDRIGRGVQVRGGALDMNGGKFGAAGFM